MRAGGCGRSCSASASPLPSRWRARARIFVVYAFATWIYRFFLFLGIALLVYHFFFKVLGIVMLVVELAWFIGRPIKNEIVEWTKRREKYRWNRHTVATGLVAAGLLAAAIVPWSSAVHAPALLRAENQAQIYVPLGARLEEIHAEPGATVEDGAPLFRFASPEMAYQLADVERRIAVLRWRASVEIGAGVEGASREVIFSELQAAVAERAALARVAERLVVTAPLAGRVVDRAVELRPGAYLPEGEWLATVADPSVATVEAYVREADLGRLAEGAPATFYPQAPGRPPLALEVARIAGTATRDLSGTPELASDYGGAIPAYRGEAGIVPDEAIYRVTLRPAPDTPAPDLALTGTVRLEAEAESFVVRAWRAAVAVLVRESGF